MHSPGSTPSPLPGPFSSPLFCPTPAPPTTPALAQALPSLGTPSTSPSPTPRQGPTWSTSRRRCVPPPSSWFGAAAWVKWPGSQLAMRVRVRVGLGLGLGLGLELGLGLGLRLRPTCHAATQSQSRISQPLIWLRLTMQVVARGGDTAARWHVTPRVESWPLGGAAAWQPGHLQRTCRGL